MAESVQKTFWEKLRFIFVPKENKGVGWADRAIIATLLGGQDAWKARPDVPKEKQLLDSLTELSDKLGIEAPKLVIYESHIPNAASLVTGNIVVGTDMLNIMTPGQLKVVLAHELSHHRHRARDLPVTLGLPVAAYGVGGAAIGDALFRSGRSFGKRLAITAGATVGIGAVGTIIPMAYQRRSELEADHDAVLVTHEPENMIGALTALENRYRQLHLMPVPVLDEDGKEIQREPTWKRYLRAHPPTSERVEQIRQLQRQEATDISSNMISR